MKEATTAISAESVSRVRRRKYDEAFKEQALKMVDNGQSVRSVAQSLGIAENILHKWKKTRNLTRTSAEAEVAELRIRLRQVEAERDILKKALSIFSRQT
jgi:transposase